jgi:hypothetical protein
MNNYMAIEQAYKNGYEKGYEDAKKNAEEEFIIRVADLNVKAEEDKLELLSGGNLSETEGAGAGLLQPKDENNIANTAMQKGRFKLDFIRQVFVIETIFIQKKKMEMS